MSNDKNTPPPRNASHAHRLLFLAVLAVVVVLVVCGHFTTDNVVAVLSALGTLYALLRE